jgi:hypothetical protein
MLLLAGAPRIGSLPPLSCAPTHLHSLQTTYAWGVDSSTRSHRRKLDERR